MESLTGDLPACRNMRGNDARLACPELHIVQVPTEHGKADLSFYRSEGKKVHYSPTVTTSFECFRVSFSYKGADDMQLSAEFLLRMTQINCSAPLPCNAP